MLNSRIKLESIGSSSNLMVCSSTKTARHWCWLTKLTHLFWHNKWCRFGRLGHLAYRYLTDADNIEVWVNSRWSSWSLTHKIIILHTHYRIVKIDAGISILTLSIYFAMLAKRIFQTHSDIGTWLIWFIRWHTGWCSSCCSNIIRQSRGHWWNGQWFEVVAGVVLLLHQLACIFWNRLEGHRSWIASWCWCWIWDAQLHLTQRRSDLIVDLDRLLADRFLLQEVLCLERVFNLGGHVCYWVWNGRSDWTSHHLTWWASCGAVGSEVAFGWRLLHGWAFKLVGSHFTNCADAWLKLRCRCQRACCWSTIHGWLECSRSRIKSASNTWLFVIKFFIKPSDHLLVTLKTLKRFF